MATSRSATVLAARRAVETLHSEGLVKDQYARFFADQQAMEIAKEGDGEVHYVLMYWFSGNWNQAA